MTRSTLALAAVCLCVSAQACVLAHLVKYADEELAAKLKDFTDAINYEYDWA